MARQSYSTRKRVRSAKAQVTIRVHKRKQRNVSIHNRFGSNITGVHVEIKYRWMGTMEFQQRFNVVSKLNSIHRERQTVGQAREIRFER